MKQVNYISSPVSTVSGDITVPGDKSISHRALMLGAIATGTTTISGFLDGEEHEYEICINARKSANPTKDDMAMTLVHEVKDARDRRVQVYHLDAVRSLPAKGSLNP